MLDAGYWMLDELGIHLFIYPVSSIQNPASRSPAMAGFEAKLH